MSDSSPKVIFKKLSYIPIIRKYSVRQLEQRLTLNYRPLSRLNIDLKVIPKSYQGYKFIICLTDEVTDYLIIVPIYQCR